MSRFSVDERVQDRRSFASLWALLWLALVGASAFLGAQSLLGREASLGSRGLPSSLRSRRALKKVRPRLKKALQKKGLRWGAPIFVRIFKQSKQLELWVQGNSKYHLFKTYRICTYSGRLGPKLKEGDGQAPEGFYFVPPRRMNPWSRYHLAFNIGYPNRYDRAHRRTGSALMVHGRCVSIGCFAMTNGRIEEIYSMAHAALARGQRYFRVHIFPFRMTAKAMKRQQKHRWAPFWRNLRQGYLAFEKTRIPPNTRVHKKRYVFTAVKRLPKRPRKRAAKPRR